MAQKKLTLDDVIPGGKNRFSFVLENLRNLTWNGDKCVYVKDKEVIAVNPRNGKQQTLLTLDDLNETLKKIDLEPLLSFPNLSFDKEGKSSCFFTYKNHFLALDWSKKEVLTHYVLPQKMANKTFCESTQSYAYTVGNNVSIVEATGDITRVTDEKKPHVVCGAAVHRFEFGIKGGLFWSPKGRYLAFYRMDESMVKDYPIVDIFKREAEVKPCKYPMAGMTSHEVTIGVYDLMTQKTVFLKTPSPVNRYFTNISWSPDEKNLLVAELNRDQNDCQLKNYDASSGELVNTIYQEKSDQYVEPEHAAFFLKKHPGQFIWQSACDGYNHLYLMDLKSGLRRQLTKGNWQVINLLGIDKKEENLFYVSTENRAINHTIYKVNIKTGKRTLLSLSEGVHHAQFSSDGRYMIDSYTALKTPRRIDLVTVKDRKRVPLLVAQNPYKEYAVPSVTLDSLQSADGEYPLYYRLIKPADFDSNKKYPAVIYVYGGPKSQMVDNSFRAKMRGWEYYMASKGYVLFVMDGRGTNYRGIKFEQETHLRLGEKEAEDQLVGAKFLQSLSYVDAERIGVHGWSFGGFMTINLLLRYPDVFKVGVAGGPVCDWKYYEVMYGERYMSTPEKNPEGYKTCSLLNRAKDLKGRLLLIHDDQDATVVWQHSLAFLKACIKANTYPDYFVYPGHLHNVAGKERVHLHEKITRYFEDYLK